MLKPQLGLLQGFFGPPQIGKRRVIWVCLSMFLKHAHACRNDRCAQHNKVTGHLFLGNSVNLEQQLDSFDFRFRIQSYKPTSNRGAIQISLDYTTGCLSLWDTAARGARGVRANSLPAAVNTTEEVKEDKAATSRAGETTRENIL